MSAIPTHSTQAVAPSFRFDVRSYVIRGEDPQQLAALAENYFAQFQPQGPVERLLVQTLILSQWSKDRWTRVETQLLDEAPDLAALVKDPASNRPLLQVARRIAFEDRRYFRALAELRRLQKLREPAEPPAQPEENKPVAQNWVCSVKSDAGPRAALPPQPEPVPIR